MIDVYIKNAAENGNMITILTAEEGVGVTIAKGEREILSIVIPWGEYWQLIRELNACERALLASQGGAGIVDCGMEGLARSFAGALGAQEVKK